MAWMIPKIDGKLASRHMEKRKEKKRKEESLIRW
jgi:hypothetical protein